MCLLAIDYIRKSIKSGNYVFSGHATTRSLEREIKTVEILDCIENGEVVEVQDFPDKDRTILFHSNDRDFYVAVAANLPCTIVTVCCTEKEVWEQIGGRIIRRSK